VPLLVAAKSCKIPTTLPTHVMDVDIDNLIEDTVFCIVLTTIQKEADLLEAVQGKKKRWDTALPGDTYVKELLNSNHPKRIQAVLRMQLNTFYALRDWLLTNTNLKDSKTITVEEKLVTFLHITTQSCDQMEGPLLFKWRLRCDFNGGVNGRNIVNGANSP
jgi:hypothetical protein